MEKAKEELYQEARQNFQSFLDRRKKDQPLPIGSAPPTCTANGSRGRARSFGASTPTVSRARCPAFLPDVHEVRQDLADYLGEIAAFDAGLGILIEELKKLGANTRTRSSW